jgi:endogenous inhibitor of DNA gyrase (YacG/DUF329 family)
MNLIVKCPGCGRHILAKAGSGFASEVALTERKTCPGCAAQVEVKIKIEAKVVKEEAKK